MRCSSRRQILMMILCASYLGSCSQTDEGGAGPEPPIPGRLEVLRGANQSGVVGSVLRDSILVRVQSTEGLAVSGVTVQWSVAVGNGTLSRASSITDGQGLASVKWTMPTTPRVVAMAIVVADLTPVNLNASATPGSPVSITVEHGDGQYTYYADSSLPEPVIVRVSDAYGNAVPYASLAWEADPAIRAEGDVAADSLGRAKGRVFVRAIPGYHSARVRATAGGALGEVGVELRIARFQWPPDTVVLWPGDSVRAAGAFDSAGARLNTPVTWLFSPDGIGWGWTPDVLGDSSGYLVGVSETAIRADVRILGARKLFRVVVAVEFSGRVTPLDATSIDSLWVVVLAEATDSTPAHADSALVDPAGTFRLRVGYAPRHLTFLSVYFRSAESVGRPFLPSGRFRNYYIPYQIDALLIPRYLRIPSGDLAGDEVPISVDRLLGHGQGDLSVPFAKYPSRIAWWPDSLLPLKVFFDSTLGDLRVTPEDSTWSDSVTAGAPNWSTQDSIDVWRELRRIEQRIGLSLFTPISKPSLPPERLWRDPGLFDLHWDQSAGGASSMCPSNGCDHYSDLYHAHSRAVTRPNSPGRSTWPLHIHEIGHAIGFGHTCYFPSVMGSIMRFDHDREVDAECDTYNEEPGNPESIGGAADFTRYDVAYLHLMRMVVTFQRRSPSEWALDETQAGELFVLREEARR